VSNGHVITSSIEHHSVLDVCHSLERKGIAVTYLPVDGKGRVSLDSLKEAIRPDTKLVSIMLANNEIGTIQPIAEIGEYLRERSILFHTDAVQAVGHIPVIVKELGVDFLTASSHKFNGAKGTGILYKRNGVSLPPLIFGGEQERGARAGTENVAGIVAAGYAISESVNDMSEIADKLSAFSQATINGIRAQIPSIIINGDENNRLQGIVNIVFDGVTGESLMHLLDLKAICVSTSSACTSRNDNPSHVLIALGLTEQQAKSAIRISYGRYNNINEVETIVSTICNAYNKILAAKL
jgi:cysteine desulfurase